MAHHGIYAEAYSEEEIAMLDQLNEQLGSVDEEITMMRIRLRRAQLAEKKAKAEGSMMELSEVRHTTAISGGEGSQSSSTTIERQTDYHYIIDRISGRLGTLLKLRAELIAAEGERGTNHIDRARQIRDALNQMIAVETGQPVPVEDTNEEPV